MSEPNENTESDKIIIRLNSPNGEETRMHIKKSTRMSKVFIRFAQEKGVQMSSLRFLVDGERIDGECTPRTLEMEDHDEVDVVLEQTGGWYLMTTFQMRCCLTSC